MIGIQRVLAIIPARGGSKRLPRKNVRDFLGRPLIAWTIIEAQKSEYIDTIVCSTDDDEIENIAKLYGCVVLRRPAELATDEATMSDVVLNVMDCHSDHRVIVVLQPTSPLRTVADIDLGILVGRYEGSVSVGPDAKTNGAVYCVDAVIFRKRPVFDAQKFFMPHERSVDINTEEDFRLAEEYGRQNRA